MLLRAVAIPALLAVASSAHAQDETAIAAARSLGQEGAILAKEGRCEEAVDKLRRAKELLAVPTILVPLGECQIALGKIVAGTENLQAAAREVLPEKAPEAFVNAQKRAREVLPAALKKLGKLNVVVEAPPGVEVTILDNGDKVSALLAGVERPADPGKHVIEASAPGYISASKTIDIVSGGREKITLKLEPDPNAPKDLPPVRPGGPPDPPRGDQPAKAPAPKGSGPMVPAGAVLLGVGGAGLVIGAVFAGLTASKQSSLDEICTDKVCPPGTEEDIDTMQTFANVSTGGFVIGGLAAAVGITFLAVGLSSDSGSGDTASLELEASPGFSGVTLRLPL